MKKTLIASSIAVSIASVAAVNANQASLPDYPFPPKPVEYITDCNTYKKGDNKHYVLVGDENGEIICDASSLQELSPEVLALFPEGTLPELRNLLTFFLIVDGDNNTIDWNGVEVELSTCGTNTCAADADLLPSLGLVVVGDGNDQFNTGGDSGEDEAEIEDFDFCNIVIGDDNSVDSVEAEGCGTGFLTLGNENEYTNNIAENSDDVGFQLGLDTDRKASADNEFYGNDYTNNIAVIKVELDSTNAIPAPSEADGFVVTSKLPRPENPYAPRPDFNTFTRNAASGGQHGILVEGDGVLLLLNSVTDAIDEGVEFEGDDSKLAPRNDDILNIAALNTIFNNYGDGLVAEHVVGTVLLANYSIENGGFDVVDTNDTCANSEDDLTRANLWAANVFEIDSADLPKDCQVDLDRGNAIEALVEEYKVAALQ